MDQFKFPCHYCEEWFFFGELTKDHVVPKGKGGRDIVENIVPACVECNHSKGDSMPNCSCVFCARAVEFFNRQFDGVPVVRKTWETTWQVRT